MKRISCYFPIIVGVSFMFISSCFYKPDYEEEYNKEKNTIYFNPKYHKKLELSWKPKIYSPFYIVIKEKMDGVKVFEDTTFSSDYIDRQYFPFENSNYKILNYQSETVFNSSLPSMNCKKTDWISNYKLNSKDSLTLIMDRPYNCSANQFVISFDNVDIPFFDENHAVVNYGNLDEVHYFDFYAYDQDNLVKYRRDSIRLFEYPKIVSSPNVYYINKYNKRIFSVNPNRKNEIIEYKIDNNMNFSVSQISQTTVSEKNEIEKILYVAENKTIFYTEKDDAIKVYCFSDGNRTHFRSKCDPIVTCNDSLFVFLEDGEIKIVNYRDALLSNDSQKPPRDLEGYKYIASFENNILITKDNKTYTYNIDTKSEKIVADYEVKKAIYVDEAVSYLNESTIKLANKKETLASFNAVNLLRYSSSSRYLFVFLNDKDIDIIDTQTGVDIAEIKECSLYCKDSLQDIISVEDKIIFLYPKTYIIVPALK